MLKNKKKFYTLFTLMLYILVRIAFVLKCSLNPLDLKGIIRMCMTCKGMLEAMLYTEASFNAHTVLLKY